MVGIYIGSVSPNAGKNLASIALGLGLRQQGYSVGYMKPYGKRPRIVEEQTGDAEALLIQDVLGLETSPELVTPVVVSPNLRSMNLHAGNRLEKVSTAYHTLATQHDIMIVGGTGALFHTGYAHGIDGHALIRRLGLKVVLVARYYRHPEGGGIDYDAILHASSILGDALVGVLLNDLPECYFRDANDVLIPFLEQHGIPVLGQVPHDPLLNAIRASELAIKLDGRITAGGRHAQRLVEGFLIGTMQVENFMTHFRRAGNAATIVGGDRTDLQLMALEGKCPCLILTGNIAPNDIIRTRAEEFGVPVIVVREDTYTVARKMEEILNRQKLRELVTIRRGADIVASSFNFTAFLTQTGIQKGG